MQAALDEKQEVVRQYRRDLEEAQAAVDKRKAEQAKVEAEQKRMEQQYLDVWERTEKEIAQKVEDARKS